MRLNYLTSISVAALMAAGAAQAEPLKIGFLATLEGTYTVLGEDGLRAELQPAGVPGKRCHQQIRLLRHFALSPLLSPSTRQSWPTGNFCRSYWFFGCRCRFSPEKKLGTHVPGTLAVRHAEGLSHKNDKMDREVGLFSVSPSFCETSSGPNAARLLQRNFLL